MERYPVDFHPFFLVRKADLLVLIGAGTIAIGLYNQVNLFIYFTTQRNINRTRLKVYCLVWGYLTKVWTPIRSSALIRSTNKSTVLWQSRDNVTADSYFLLNMAI